MSENQELLEEAYKSARRIRTLAEHQLSEAQNTLRLANADIESIEEQLDSCKHLFVFRKGDRLEVTEKHNGMTFRGIALNSLRHDGYSHFTIQHGPDVLEFNAKYVEIANLTK